MTPTEAWEAAWLLDYPEKEGALQSPTVDPRMKELVLARKQGYRAGYLAALAERQGELRKARLDLITEIFLLRGPWEERLGNLRTKYFTKGTDPNGNEPR